MTDTAITSATEAYNAALSVLTSRPWRQGMSEPCNLYEIAGDEPDRERDHRVGCMLTPELAAEACAAHNAALLARKADAQAEAGGSPGPSRFPATLSP